MSGKDWTPMPVVYIAGPFTNPPGEQHANVLRMITAGHSVMNLGAAVIVPLLFYYMNEHISRPDEEWLSVDLELVTRCDYLYRMPGESAGADLEVAQAKRHEIPVFTHIGDLARVLRAEWAATEGAAQREEQCQTRR